MQPAERRQRSVRVEIERAPGSEAARRFPVTISTDSPIVRRDLDGPYEEILSHEEGAIDLSRAPIPVIEGHDLSKTNIGVVENLRVERDGKLRRLRGELVLGKQARAQELAADIAEGIVRGLSVGCAVDDVQEQAASAGRKRRVTVTRWTPHECSLVAVPADISAGIRREKKEKNMSKTLNRAAVIDDSNPADQETELDTSELDDGGEVQLTRSARAERTRIAAILRLTREADVAESVADDLIRRGVPLSEARTVVMGAMAAEQRRSQPNTRSQHIEMGTDYESPEFLSRAIGEAIHARVNPAYKPSESSHPFIGRSLVELARECLHQRNISTRSLAASQVVTRALGGLMGVSDFQLALGDAIGRELLRSFEASDPGVLRVARAVTASDFRAHHPIKIGDAPALKKVNEHGEYHSGPVIEAGEAAWKLETYGRIIGLTRQAIINDDLGVFTDLPRRMGIEARELEAQTVVDLLVSNAGAGPTMGDSVALFHAQHGNLAGSGAAIGVTTLGAARAAMRLQKSLNGRVVNFTPKFLIVPASKETVAEQLLAEISATNSDDVNPFSGKLELIVEPRLDAVSTTAWYVVADPGRYDGLAAARLAGSNGPVIETQRGFRIDGVEWRVSHDFGAGFVEHRSFFKNNGA